MSAQFPRTEGDNGAAEIKLLLKVSDPGISAPTSSPLTDQHLWKPQSSPVGIISMSSSAVRIQKINDTTETHKTWFTDWSPDGFTT
jgi:hypothetical protein